MFRLLSFCFVASLALGACAVENQEETAPDVHASIRVFESPCYFNCTSYEIEVHPDGHYRLNNQSNTRADGVREGSFGPEVWAKAEAAFAAARFDTQPEKITGEASSASSGLPCIHDLPEVRFTRRTGAGEEKTVQWNTGCPSPELGNLRDTLRTLFQYEALVKPAA